MDKVKQFRQREKECLESAANAPNSEVRGHYEELARIWKKLAEERLAFFVIPPGGDGANEQGLGGENE
jgi:hypothetical protein